MGAGNGINQGFFCSLPQLTIDSLMMTLLRQKTLFYFHSAQKFPFLYVFYSPKCHKIHCWRIMMTSYHDRASGWKEREKIWRIMEFFAINRFFYLLPTWTRKIWIHFNIFVHSNSRFEGINRKPCDSFQSFIFNRSI